MDDKTKGLIDRLLELERIAQQATPGPWCVESLGEKGDGSNVIGVAFGPDDQNAERPLSGWLEPFDKDGDEIDYYRDEEVAACEHRNRNSGPNAIYIMTFDPPTVLAMIATIRAQAEEIEGWSKWGIVEIAVRNPSVMEYTKHWEGRAEAAEAELARIKSAEGCDVEGALDAYMDAPNKGLPYDSLVQQRMSAALAAGCAPLRAKLALHETALRKIACWHVVAPEVNYPHYASMAVVTAREVVSQKEPANGNP